MNRNKKLGMLLGLHCGDSLGATLEFGPPTKTKAEIHKEIIGGGHFGWKAGDATDDTDLMICVLKSIWNNQFNVSVCEQYLIEWYNNHPKDIGSTTQRAILKLLKQNQEEFKNISLSNGSLMRCAPLALIDCAEEQLHSFIKIQNNITHEMNDAYLADLCLIKAIKLIGEGKSKEQIYNLILNWSEKNFISFHKYFLHLHAIKWDKLPTSGSVYETLFAAFWALLKCNSFEDALILIVNRGDDSDTCGAVAGALCGAYYGVDNIPQRWLNTIQRKNEIEQELDRIIQSVV